MCVCVGGGGVWWFRVSSGDLGTQPSSAVDRGWWCGVGGGRGHHMPFTVVESVFSLGGVGWGAGYNMPQ